MYVKVCPPDHRKCLVVISSYDVTGSWICKTCLGFAAAHEVELKIDETTDAEIFINMANFFLFFQGCEYSRAGGERGTRCARNTATSGTFQL